MDDHHRNNETSSLDARAHTRLDDSPHNDGNVLEASNTTHISVAGEIPPHSAAPAVGGSPHPRSSEENDDDSHSMPDLQSLSDFSEEMDVWNPHDAVEEELMNHVQHVAENNEVFNRANAFVDVPPLEPIPPRVNRRARVDEGEEGDGERDRRHPSQRSPQSGNGSQTWTFARSLGIEGSHLVERFFATGGRPPPSRSAPQPNPTEVPTANGEQGAAPSQPNASPSRAQVVSGVMTVNIDNQGRIVGPPPAPNIRFGPVFAFGSPNAGEAPQVAADFAQLFQAFGMAPVPEVEDPERAKKLIDALDEVPHGLVRRLERLGGLPGGHTSIDGSGTSGGCAICWDSLLDSDGGNFGNKSATQATGNTAESCSSPSPTATSAPQNKIVSLPCAHVFHASCLVPWFSRPRQATCPTCRFNIDPENLTYRRLRPPPPAPPQDPTGAQTQSADSQNPSTQTALPTAPSTNPQQSPPAQAAPEQQFVVPPLSFPANAPPGALPPLFFTSMFPMQFMPLPRPHTQPQPESQPQSQPPLAADAAADTTHPNAGGGDTEWAEDVRAHTRDVLSASMDTLLDLLVNTRPSAADDVPSNGNAASEADATGNTVDDTTVNPSANGPNANPSENTNATGNNTGHMLIQEIFHVDINMELNIPGGPRMNPDTTGNAQPAFIAAGLPRPGRTRGAPPRPRRERKRWTLPPAPGPSLRQRVEEQEREAGLRCFDVSCGFGPFDDDPCPSSLAAGVKQLSIRPGKGSRALGTSVCNHTFHPGCLISAERVAGWGGEGKVIEEDDVQVACPVCRAVGCISKGEWDEGVRALA